MRKRDGRTRALGTRANGDPAGAQPALDPRLCVECIGLRRRFRLPTVIDDDSRECPACILDTSLSGRRAVRELTAIAERHGLPCMVVSDDRTEMTSHAVLAWYQHTGVEWHYVAPDKPQQNGFRA